jgi:WD40-like Beta Propeller Repeat
MIKKTIIVLLTMLHTMVAFTQMNTDIYLCNIIVSENGININEPLNITKRKGYDNQPSFSNNGKMIYYSANYTGTNDIYCYEIEGKRTLTITNTPATSEFSPMETPDGNFISCVFIEKDSVTQRIWDIKLKNRKEKVFSKYNDSIGYYWPLDNQWSQNEYMAVNGAVRKVQAERDYAVFVLGKTENTNTLRIITPTRKYAKEKTIDDSIGRCIRQIPEELHLTYVKKTATGNHLKIYDLKHKKIISSYFLGKDNEDYCWKGKMLYYTNGSTITAVRFDRGYDKPSVYGTVDLSKYGINNIKRISCFENKFAFVADDN